MVPAVGSKRGYGWNTPPETLMRRCGMEGEVGVGEASGRAANTDTPRYLPIAEHGLIGDLRTSALVGTSAPSD
jgi:hypothetical protein